MHKNTPRTDKKDIFYLYCNKRLHVSIYKFARLKFVEYQNSMQFWDILECWNCCILTHYIMQTTRCFMWQLSQIIWCQILGSNIGELNVPNYKGLNCMDKECTDQNTHLIKVVWSTNIFKCWNIQSSKYMNRLSGKCFSHILLVSPT